MRATRGYTVKVWHPDEKAHSSQKSWQGKWVRTAPRDLKAGDRVQVFSKLETIYDGEYLVTSEAELIEPGTERSSRVWRFGVNAYVDIIAK